MALYIDSAYLEDISNTAQILPLSGVTTNPTLLLDAYQRGQQLHALEILQTLLSSLNGIVFMQPSVRDEESAYQEALAYIQVDPERVIPKIPLTEIGLCVAKHIKKQGYRVAFTAVTSVSQAYIAGLCGADFIIPYYNRLRRSGVDANERISDMARVLRTQSQQTRILVASIKSPQEAAEALRAGAHDLTVPPTILLSMVKDPETEQAVTRFEQDWCKMNIL